MLTLEEYYMGRDKTYAKELTDELRANAVETLRRANLLLDKFCEANVGGVHDRGIHSGWRPEEINESIANAAPKSNHIICKAVDIGDRDGDLDKWLMTPAGQVALTEIGLWLEAPAYTPGWCHVQIVPPHSGHRVFIP